MDPLNATDSSPCTRRLSSLACLTSVCSAVMIPASCSTSVVITAVSPVLLLNDYTFLYATVIDSNNYCAVRLNLLSDNI